MNSVDLLALACHEVCHGQKCLRETKQIALCFVSTNVANCFLLTLGEVAQRFSSVLTLNMGSDIMSSLSLLPLYPPPSRCLTSDYRSAGVACNPLYWTPKPRSHHSTTAAEAATQTKQSGECVRGVHHEGAGEPPLASPHSASDAKPSDDTEGTCMQWQPGQQ